MKMQISEEAVRVLLHYGKVLTDENIYDGVQQRWVRIRVFRSHLGWLWYTKMVDGRWVEVYRLLEGCV